MQVHEGIPRGKTRACSPREEARQLFSGLSLLCKYTYIHICIN